MIRLRFELTNSHVALQDIESFYQFISALPLFGEVLTKEQNDEIAQDIAEAFQQHCNKAYHGKLICVGEMIIVKAHRT